jgi:transcriptional regulator with GAF, ATPase, and Fis domain
MTPDLSPFAEDRVSGPILAKWFQWAETSPIGQPLAADVLAPGDSVAIRWLSRLLPAVADAVRTESAAVFYQSGPRWASVQSGGVIPQNDETLALVADAAESRRPVRRGDLAAYSGSPDDSGWTTEPWVLVVRQSPTAAAPRDTTASKDDDLRRAVQVLAVLIGMQNQADAVVRHSSHLRTLLDASIRWSMIDDPDELLVAVASAATEMLGAERASIFLWDKRRGKLVGRPALGVEGGRLEVDDDAGIVGAVLGSGAPQIWTAGDDRESEVNRSVDRKLRFVTRSLVAVPMRYASGEIVGVFEVINKIGQDRGVPDRKAMSFDKNDVQRLTDLSRHAAAAIHAVQTRHRLTRTRDRLISDAASTYQVIGNSPAIRTLRDTISRVAPTELAVLALGENGTGKEVIARSLHFQSHRRDEPFVAVNCAALVESLLESELFGHERGAFTDAHQARPGKFELASGGTLFLDEIGDMSPGGQAKLLRVLEDKIVVRVGGSVPIPVDVRIIAATNQSLPELVAARRFREDLFFRLNVVSFRLPPLRERGDDILMLADHFLSQFAAQIGRVKPTFSDSARRAMLAYRWPGNVRELRNVMERASYLAPGDILGETDLGLANGAGPTKPRPDAEPAGLGRPAAQSAAESGTSLTAATADFQVELIKQAIERQRGNMTAAAQSLGLHRSNLYRKMRQLGMNTDRWDHAADSP